MKPHTQSPATRQPVRAPLTAARRQVRIAAFHALLLHDQLETTP